MTDRSGDGPSDRPVDTAELRAAYARLLAARAASPNAASADDPDADALLALAEGRGTEEERLRTLERVMRTSRGREELEIVRAAVRAARERAADTAPPWPVTSAPRAVPTWRPRRRTVLGGIAGALAAAALLLVVRSDRRTETTPLAPDIRRGPGVEPQLALVAPADGDIVSSVPRFVWRRAQGATLYRLDIVDEAGAAVYGASTADTTFTLPADVRLAPGRAYTWWVRAEESTLRASPRRFVAGPTHQ